MKQFSCGDVVPGCGHVFRAPDDDGILAAAAVHARDHHGIPEMPSTLVDQIRSHILVAA